MGPLRIFLLTPTSTDAHSLDGPAFTATEGRSPAELYDLSTSALSGKTKLSLRDVLEDWLSVGRGCTRGTSLPSPNSCDVSLRLGCNLLVLTWSLVFEVVVGKLESTTVFKPVSSAFISPLKFSSGVVDISWLSV